MATETDIAFVTQAARQARDVAINFILETNDPELTMIFVDALCLTKSEMAGLIEEVQTLRDRGAPPSAYAAWHRDLCGVLRKLLEEAREADAEAQRKSTMVADALNALGYGNPDR